MKYPLNPEVDVPVVFAGGDAPVPKQQQNEAASNRGKSAKQSHDTISGCRENARFDTAQGEKMGTGNARSKYEQSAASWTARGDMLQRFQDNQEARLTANSEPKPS